MSQDGMDVDGGGAAQEGLIDESLSRIGGVRLQSVPSRGDNVDVAPSGAVLVRCDEAIHIVHVADQVATFLPRDSSDKLRHYDDSTRFTPLFRYHVPISTTAAQTRFVSGQNALGAADGVDSMPFDTRFMHAAWAPSEIGPLASPIFAALTTKRTLFIYIAPTNQFRGPWVVLQCVNDDPTQKEGQTAISAFTWLSSSTTADSSAPVRLVGGGVDGRLYFWSVQRDSGQYDVRLDYSWDASSFPITSLSCSEMIRGSSCRLAVVSLGGVQIVSVELASDTMDIGGTMALANVDAGLSITWLSWTGTTLIYCSPGEVHGVQTDIVGATWTAILHDEREEGGSMYLQPPAGVKLDWQGAWCVTLQDGFVYLFDPDAKGVPETFVVHPLAEIAVPIEELAEEQRAVERLRGLFSRRDDGAGLTFLCHDANDIAAWTYVINGVCQLDICIIDKKAGGNEVDDLERAKDTLKRMWAMEAYGKAGEAVLVAQKQAKLRRSLLMHYRESTKKAAIVDLCIDRIAQALAVEHMPNLKVAVQLASWLKNEKDLTQEARERIASLVDNLELASTRDGLTRQVASCSAALEAHPRRQEMKDEVHARLLVVWIMIASASTAEQPHQPSSATWDVAQRLGWQTGDTKTITSWAARLHKHADVDVGELCPACDAPVPISAASLYDAHCRNGHPWRRCGVTHAIMTDIQALCCSVCARQATRPVDATSDVQRILLNAAERCNVCGGSWVAL